MSQREQFGHDAEWVELYEEYRALGELVGLDATYAAGHTPSSKALRTSQLAWAMCAIETRILEAAA